MYRVNTILSFRLAYWEDTVRRTISSTVPNLTSGYSTITIDDNTIVDVHEDNINHDTSTDGEILLIRLMYRVQAQVKYEMIRPIHLIYDNDVDTTSIATLRIVLVVLYQHAYNEAQDDNGVKDNQNTNALVVLYQAKYEMKLLFDIVHLVVLHNQEDDNTNIAITQIVIPYQDACFDDNNIAITQPIIYQDVHNDRYGYSITTIDGEWKLLFRSAYRVDKMYRVDTILSSIVLLLLQPGSIQAVLYQDVHDNDDNDDDYFKCQVITTDDSSSNNNKKKKGKDDLKDSKEDTKDHKDDTGKNGETTKPVDDIFSIEARADIGDNDTLNMNVLVVLF